MSISKLFLSGSANGLPVKVVAAATPGTTIHTAVAGTASKDEVWIYASNTDTVDRKLTIQFGGTTDPDNDLKVIVPFGDSVIAVPGIPINNGLVVKAYADAANVVTVWGYVNQIT